MELQFSIILLKKEKKPTPYHLPPKISLLVSAALL